MWSEDALIDTGSPACLFTRNVGEAVGVDFQRKGAIYDNFEILGHREVAQRESVRVTLNQWPDLSWELDAWFFVEKWDWKLPVGALFGTEGFLTQWAVTFVRPLNIFVIASPDSLWRLTGDDEGKPTVVGLSHKEPEQRPSLDPLDPEDLSHLVQYREEWDTP